MLEHAVSSFTSPGLKKERNRKDSGETDRERQRDREIKQNIPMDPVTCHWLFFIVDLMRGRGRTDMDPLSVLISDRMQGD